MSKIIFQEQSAPATPDTGLHSVYVDSTTGKLASKDDAGLVVGYGNSNINSMSVLGSDFQITGSDGVFQDTGLSLTLPVAGTYLITGTVRGVVQASAAGGYIVAKLYNSTDAADISNSETLLIYSADTAIHQASAAMVVSSIVVTASKVIKLYASRNGSGLSFTYSHISSSSAGGRTRLAYIKLG